MNLQELASPFRIYWDVRPVGRNTERDIRRICRELIDSKILSLHVTETGLEISSACLAVLDELKDKPVALFLTAPRQAVERSISDHLRGVRLKLLFVSAESCEELEPVLDLSRRAGGDPLTGVSFPVNRQNYVRLPDVITFCIKHGLMNLVLPMQRLMNSEECFFLSKKERHELSARLGEISRPDDLKITIHDPFLWKAFHPSIEFPGGGCQAANTMLYISPEMEVYPCPSVSVRIGNLKKEPFKVVAHSEAKREVRKRLLAAPPRCVECEDFDQCKGGCRGRAHAIHSSLQEPDPACS